MLLYICCVCSLFNDGICLTVLEQSTWQHIRGSRRVLGTGHRRPECSFRTLLFESLVLNILKHICNYLHRIVWHCPHNVGPRMSFSVRFYGPVFTWTAVIGLCVQRGHVFLCVGSWIWSSTSSSSTWFRHVGFVYSQFISAECVYFFTTFPIVLFIEVCGQVISI